LDLEDFCFQFQQEILAEANIEDVEKFTEDVFVDRMIEYLHEAQEIENGIACSFKGYGMKVNGYDINTQNNAIDIFVADYFGYQSGSVQKIGKNEIETAFKRAANFLLKSLKGHHEKLEESAEVYDLSKIIYDTKNELKRSRIILLTDRISGSLPGRTETNDGIEISYQIWDIERLFRFVTSGMKKEPIEVNFVDEFGTCIPCISCNGSSEIYDTYLAIIPGFILAKLYDRWGTRLLERNVRAFLQARGKVNRGIRDTIIEEPNMFLAYNNGITVTASFVETEHLSSGGLGIKNIYDFQIVNGGQTIASIWHTHVHRKAPIDDVSLQMKLTVITDSEKTEEIAPLISKYSNTQNKVNTADFHANDPFHINLEKISRSIWAPDPTGGGQQTIWFYERARGSYDETRNREMTDAKMKRWSAIHPRKQKFDKLFLGKVEKTWMMQPHIVSRGAQKNFADFSIDLKEGNASEVDEDYFKDLVAKIIIWKNAERIISAQNIPGYRANIVTYSISWLLSLTGFRIDLPTIWKNQEISDALRETIDFLGYKVRDHITDTTSNVTEWCKKEICWKKIIQKRIEIPTSLQNELIDTSKASMIEGRQPSKEELELVEWVSSISPDIWFSIARWGKLTKTLESWEKSISFSMGRIIARGKRPSIKQAIQAKKIYDKANRMGFKPTS
jgi:hypothetical protein